MRIGRAIWAGATLAFLQTVPICPAAAAASPAVAYQMNVAHDGNVNFKKGFSLPLKRLWIRDLKHTASYPLIVNGLIFVTTPSSSPDGAALVALDQKTGDIVWKNLFPASLAWATAAYDNGRVFVITFDNILSAFAADRTGALLWRVQLPGQPFSSSPPIAYKGMVFVGGTGGAGTLYGVDESTGAVEWANLVENGDGSSPAFGDGGVYATYPCQYYKFDPKSGRQIWNTDGGCEGGGGLTPVYFQDRVFARDSGSVLNILNADTGRITASFSAQYAPATYQDAQGNSYFFVMSGGQLQARALDSQAVLWTFSARNF